MRMRIVVDSWAAQVVVGNCLLMNSFACAQKGLGDIIHVGRLLHSLVAEVAKHSNSQPCSSLSSESCHDLFRSPNLSVKVVEYPMSG